MAIVLLAVPKFVEVLKIFARPRPSSAPEGKIGQSWPLYFVHQAFLYNKRFGMLFLLGILLDLVIIKSGIFQF